MTNHNYNNIGKINYATYITIKLIMPPTALRKPYTSNYNRVLLIISNWKTLKYMMLTIFDGNMIIERTSVCKNRQEICLVVT